MKNREIPRLELELQPAVETSQPVRSDEVPESKACTMCGRFRFPVAMKCYWCLAS